MTEFSDNIKKTERPEIPADYFSGLSSKLMTDIQKEPKAKVLPLYRRPIIWSVAASICVLFGISYFLYKANELTFDSLSKTEVLAYVQDNIDDFDEELIIEAMSESAFEVELSDTTKKLSKTKNEVNQNSKQVVAFEALTEEEILEYLNSQELSIEELEEEIEQ